MLIISDSTLNFCLNAPPQVSIEEASAKQLKHFSLDQAAKLSIQMAQMGHTPSPTWLKALTKLVRAHLTAAAAASDADSSDRSTGSGSASGATSQGVSLTASLTASLSSDSDDEALVVGNVAGDSDSDSETHGARRRWRSGPPPTVESLSLVVAALARWSQLAAAAPATAAATATMGPSAQGTVAESVSASSGTKKGSASAAANGTSMSSGSSKDSLREAAVVLAGASPVSWAWLTLLARGFMVGAVQLL